MRTEFGILYKYMYLPGSAENVQALLDAHSLEVFFKGTWCLNNFNNLILSF